MDSSRNRYEAVFAIRYAMRLDVLHSRFYRRLRFLLTGLSLFSGMGAVVSLISKVSILAVVVGLLVAFVTVVDLLVAPTEKLFLFDGLHKKWGDLYSIADEIPSDDLKKKIRALQADVSPEIEALRWIAYNETLKEMGRDEFMVKNNFWHRVMAMIV